MRDEHFSKYRPIVPQRKVWQVKATDQPAAGPVEPTPVTGQTGATGQSDRPGSPVRPVEPSAKQTVQVEPVLVSYVDEAPLAPQAKEDEVLVDYEASSEHSNMEINVVHMSSDYFVVPKDEATQLQCGPRDAMFQKPKESDNHLKALTSGGISMGSRFLACL